MLESSAITPKLPLAILTLHSMLCKSPNRVAFCWLDLIDTEIGDGDINPGSWRNDNPQGSIFSIRAPLSGHNYLIKG